MLEGDGEPLENLAAGQERFAVHRRHVTRRVAPAGLLYPSEVADGRRPYGAQVFARRGHEGIVEGGVGAPHQAR